MLLITPPPSEFADNLFSIFDDVDVTKKLAFSVGAITAGTTRTWSWRDRNDTVVGTIELSDAFTSGTFIIGGDWTFNGNPSFNGTTTIAGTLECVTGGPGTVHVGDGTRFRVRNVADPTKEMAWDLSGATTGKVLTFAAPITNNRTLTAPDLTGTFAIANATQAIAGPWTFGSGAFIAGATTDDATVPVFNTTYNSGTGANEILRIEDNASSTASGFHITLRMGASAIPLTGNVTINMPAVLTGNGTLVVTTGISNDVLLGKELGTFSSTGGIRCGTNTNGNMKFMNSTSRTQFMMFDLALLTAQRNIKVTDAAGTMLTDGNVLTYGGDVLTYADDVLYY